MEMLRREWIDLNREIYRLSQKRNEFRHRFDLLKGLLDDLPRELGGANGLNY
jgi:hypothetical protein